MKNVLLLGAVILASALPATSQVNSGSDGHDGAFNPTQNVEIDMADHPDGIYHYTSVNIPSGVAVTFKPNAANTPVVWLVQGNCVISGSVSVNGKPGESDPGFGGPGGFRGGGVGGSDTPAGDGLGPGGGIAGPNGCPGGNGSFGTIGAVGFGQGFPQGEPGSSYGSPFLVPLIGGSGGSGLQWTKGGKGGGGGAGAILIVSNGEINIQGSIQANGGPGSLGVIDYDTPGSGAGSGGGVRLVSTTIKGNGSINTAGGNTPWYRYNWCRCTWNSQAGKGRVRLDALYNTFTGTIFAEHSRGYQPVIFPPANQAGTLAIQSVGGFAVNQVPSGNLTSPDVIVPAAQQNPVSIVVGCTNIPLGTEIIVDVKPSNGPAIRAVGLNNVGTQASSTATVQVQMPRGGGTIQAKAISGIQLAANDDPNAEHLSLAQTGWTADGERFKAVEVTAGLGVSSQLAYVTESGKRYTLGSR